MDRPLRIEFAGALYYVTSRGNGREDIYREDIYREDAGRELFMAILGDVRGLGNFGEQEKDAIRRYRQFVADGVQQPSPCTLLKHPICFWAERTLSGKYAGH